MSYEVRNARPVDVLLISHFEDVGLFDTEVAPGPWLARANASGSGSAGRVKDARRERQAVYVDGQCYDLARFMSWVRYGSTRHYRRFDTHTMTHLCGTYFESFMLRSGYTLRHVNHATRFDLAALAEQIAPRYVMISTTFLPEPGAIGEVTQLVKALWPGIPVLLGGQILIEFAKIIPPHVFRDYLHQWDADAVVISARAESQLLAIVSHEPDELPGLQLAATWLRQRDGTYARNALPDVQAPIDEFAVHWDALNPDTLYPIVNMRTARSCSFRCAFCSHPANNGPFNPATLHMVRDELDRLAGHPVIRRVAFTDDTFNVPLKRFQAVLDLIAGRGLEWSCYFRCQNATEDIVKRMRDAGCSSVFLGVESIDDQVLKNMDKGGRKHHYDRGVGWLKKHGIATHANFVLGYPGAQLDCAERMIEWVDEHDVDFYCASPWYCSPATPVWRRRKEFGIVGRYYNWRHDTMTSTQAMELDAWAVGAARRSAFISETTSHSGWTAWFLLANGLSSDEIRTLMGLYNGLSGRDTDAETVRAMPEFATVKRLIEDARFPNAPDADLTMTPARSDEELASLDQVVPAH